MPKFRVKKVNRFGYQGKNYYPGDIVELPERFEGLDFLEPVKPEPVKKVESKTKKKPKKTHKKGS